VPELPIKITLITPTGHRPESWELCKKYIRRQSIWREGYDIQWLAVIDEENPLDEDPDFKIIQSPELWVPGKNTQKINLKTALPHIEGDYIFVIEDDDWYHPMHIEVLLSFLQQGYWLVGEGNAKYYHVGTRQFRELNNCHFATMPQTAFRKDALSLFEEALDVPRTIDAAFWSRAKLEGVSTFIFVDTGLVCGMKGLPGRPGIGLGHRPHRKDWRTDTNFSILKSWVGEDDFETYLEIHRKLNSHKRFFNQKPLLPEGP
jgi:hypothetical protein